MAQPQQGTISHFSHPGHELVKRHYTGPFRCDMCWEDLSGPGHGCRACDFSIHEACASHPQRFSSPALHAHPLVLVQTRRDAALLCDICVGSCAPGCFLYRCTPCGFDMHPGCTQLPRVVCSAHHSEHDLTLVRSEGRCTACHCRSAIREWFYRCTVCDIDYHVSCAAAGGGQENNNEATHNQAADRRAPPGAMRGRNVPAPDVTQAYDELLELIRLREEFRLTSITTAAAVASSSEVIDILGRM